MTRIAAIALFALLAPAGVSATTAEVFPRPEALEPAVRFWTRIYSQVPTSAGLIHDRDNLAIVYERVDLGEGVNRRQRSAQVRERKKHYRQLLLEIVRGDRDDLGPEAQRVLSLWPNGVSDARLERAAYNIRFQLGQSDKFRAGLVRSGAWEPHIRRTLKRMGLPEELAALPHVESSFNPDAWSRVGAAGLWQFTRSTGRRYMRIDHVVDERMDPFKSTLAAARLLEHNYSVTGSWALALTAYNHGLAGVRRAVRQVGTNDIATLAEGYRSRSWGFASRNFYAAFLAAVEVDFHAERYFGLIERRDAIRSETVELPFYVPVDALVDAFEVDRARLRELNRALRDPVWEGLKRVPRGYELRVPAGPDRPPARELLARVEDEARYYAQIPDRYHRVRRGEALSAIARRYGVSTRELVALNNLQSRNLIRAGQTLRLPVPAGSGNDTAAADGTYTVRRGDTLSRIAQRVGLSVGDIAAANDLDDQHRIFPGQELRVDGRPAGDADAVASRDEADAAGTDADAEARETVVALAASGGDAIADEDTTAAGETTPDGTASDAPAASAATGPADPVGAAAVPPPAPAPVSGPRQSASITDRATAPTPQRLVLMGGLRRLGPAASSGDGSEFVDATAPEDVEPEPKHDLSADPSDYAVADDGTIEVQAAETLGHYAEWLDLRASQLRRVNDMRYGTPVVIGNRLELDFSRVEPATFEERRLQYHEDLQARFFEQFRITGTERQLVERGDSLWTLARRSDNVPVWLLRQYNPDLDFSALRPGMPVTLPVVERQAQADDGTGGGTRAETQGAAGGSGA